LEDLPQVLQPQSGFAYNTNHSPFHATEGSDNAVIKDPTMGYETLENNRSMRFAELMAQHKTIDFDSFKKIKFDRQFPSKFYFPINIDNLFALNATDYPDIADLIGQLNTWDKKGDANNIGAATFLMLYDSIYKHKKIYMASPVLSKELAITLFRGVKSGMLKDFGRTNLALGDIQKMVRGDKEVPAPGLPDVLAPMYSIPYKNGMLKGNQGDAYIELVRFTKDGPIIESINTYGASAHADSPHYTDQMEMYTKQQTKKMSLDKKTVYANAEKIYHPN
jgi:acyl-homoserine-lactone acylase